MTSNGATTRTSLTWSEVKRGSANSAQLFSATPTRSAASAGAAAMRASRSASKTVRMAESEHGSRPPDAALSPVLLEQLRRILRLVQEEARRVEDLAVAQAAEPAH